MRPSNSQVRDQSLDVQYDADMRLICLGENNLSFIETSALDASNVELAFQNILTGEFIINSLTSVR